MRIVFLRGLDYDRVGAFHEGRTDGRGPMSAELKGWPYRSPGRSADPSSETILGNPFFKRDEAAMLKTGPNQHFIPQSLLRLFRNSPAGRVARVHVFRRDRNYVSPTNEVASQRNFYSGCADGEQGMEEDLDAVITRHENGPYNADFVALLSLPAGDIDPQLAARVVSHLVGRGDHIRGSIRSGASALGELVDQLFSSPEYVVDLVGAADPLPGARFHEVFQSNIADNPLLEQLGLPHPVLEVLSYAMLRENAGESADEVSAHVRNLSQHLIASAGVMAKSAQVKALASGLMPAERVEQLSGLMWRIVDVPGTDLILPDFVVLARDAEGRPGTVFSFDAAGLEEVQMPLGPHRLLVGQREFRSPRASDFNGDAAPLCRDFFVSARSAPEFEVFAAGIGREADADVLKGLDDAASEIRDRLGRVDDGPSEHADAGPWLAATGRGFSLETDLLDQEEAERLGGILASIVRLARSRFDVDQLVRFVIKADYAAAIASVNRGELEDGEVLAPSSTDSVTFNVLVEEHGQHGIAVVIRRDVGMLLLSDDDPLFAGGVSAVLGRLAFLGATALITAVFAKGVDAGDAHDRYLLERSIGAWRTWLVATYEASFSGEVCAWHREGLLTALVSLPDELVGQRRRYRETGDVDGLITAAVGCAVRVLNAAARAAAAVRGDEATAVFRQGLESVGWAKWFSLFERELAAIWTEGTAYPPQSAFLVLSRHVQRLLFSGAIFLWDPGDGGIRVEVPHWSDLQ